MYSLRLRATLGVSLTCKCDMKDGHSGLHAVFGPGKEACIDLRAFSSSILVGSWYTGATCCAWL